MKAFMLGNAVNGSVIGALTAVGTPNLLLQTDLSRQATVTIAPGVLAPVILFEGSFSTASTQTITLTNTDTNSSSLVSFQVCNHSHAHSCQHYLLLPCLPKRSSRLHGRVRRAPLIGGSFVCCCRRACRPLEFWADGFPQLPPTAQSLLATARP